MPSDIKVIDGRREAWLDLGPLLGAGWVCAESDDSPDGVCGMPVESEPCTIHHLGVPDAA